MRRNRTYKQIEDSRNTRLWITSVILPSVMVANSLYNNNPEIQKSVNNAINTVGTTIKKVGVSVTKVFKKDK